MSLNGGSHLPTWRACKTFEAIEMTECHASMKILRVGTTTAVSGAYNYSYYDYTCARAYSKYCDFPAPRRCCGIQKIKTKYSEWRLRPQCVESGLRVDGVLLYNSKSDWTTITVSETAALSSLWRVYTSEIIDATFFTLPISNEIGTDETYSAKCARIHYSIVPLRVRVGQAKAPTFIRSPG